MRAMTRQELIQQAAIRAAQQRRQAVQQRATAKQPGQVQAAQQAQQAALQQPVTGQSVNSWGQPPVQNTQQQLAAQQATYKSQPIQQPSHQNMYPPYQGSALEEYTALNTPVPKQYNSGPSNMQYKPEQWDINTNLGSAAMPITNVSFAQQQIDKGYEPARGMAQQQAQAQQKPGFVGAFKKGGKVPKTGIALVHKGEHVLTEKQAKNPKIKAIIAEVITPKAKVAAKPVASVMPKKAVVVAKAPKKLPVVAATTPKPAPKMKKPETTAQYIARRNKQTMKRGC